MKNMDDTKCWRCYRAGVAKYDPLARSLHCLFLNKILLEYSLCPFLYIFADAFMLLEQNSITAAETLKPTKTKIFIS